MRKGHPRREQGYFAFLFCRLRSMVIKMKELWEILDENGNKTGRLHERGTPMKPGEYHLAVTIWIVNREGKLLISKRAPEKKFSGRWEPTQGSGLVGEDSLTTALREAKEELGITLLPENGTLFRQYTYPHGDDPGSVWFHTWIFRQEFDLKNVILKPGETCDAMWASQDEIRKMMQDGSFSPYDYLEELFSIL